MKLNEPTRAEIRFLEEFYSKDYIQSVKVMKGNELIFIFTNPADYEKLTQKHIEVLFMLENQEELHTPVFVELDAGILCIE